MKNTTSWRGCGKSAFEMYDQIKKLGRHSVVYGLGGVLTQIVGILLIPIYSRYLTPEDYGVIQVLLVTAGFLSIVMELGFKTALFRSIMHDNFHDKQTVYSTAFYTMLASGFIMLGLGIAFARGISTLLFNSSEYSYVVRIMLATTVLEFLDVIPLTKLRIEGRSTQYSILNFSAFLLRMLLQILFVVVLRRGAAGSIEANAIQALLFGFYYLFIIKEDLVVQYSKSAVGALLQVGLPLIPVLLAGKILVMADRYFLAHYAGLDEVGIYSMGYKIATAVSLAVGAFQTAWSPALYAAAKKPDYMRFYARTMTYVVFVCGYLALGLSALAQDTLKILVAPEYFSAYQVVPLVSLSYVFYGAYFVTITGMQLHNKMYQLPYVTISAAVFQSALNFLLIPSMGMMGAALSTTASYFFMPLLAVWLSRGYFHVKYEYDRLAKIILVGVGLYFLSLLIQVENLWLSFAYRGALAASFPFILYFAGFYSREEKERAGLVWQKIKSRFLMQGDNG
jgi:O-antigen/teichoic acid export membrane protein